MINNIITHRSDAWTNNIIAYRPATLTKIITYRPTVCRHTDTEHVHYSVVLIKQKRFNTDFEALQELSSRVGGQTAGQVIEAIQDKLAVGINLHWYGVYFIETRLRPLIEICNYDGYDPPTISWDKPLFTPIQVFKDTVVPKKVWVGKISYR